MKDKLQHKMSRWGSEAHMAFNQICHAFSIWTHERTRRWHITVLKSVKDEKKIFWFINNDNSTREKKNPIAKVLVSYLGSWVQSLTCQQPLGGQFFALLYLSNLFSFTSLPVKWVYWHFSTAGVWGKEVPRFNRALKELFLKSWLFPILLRIFWCACNRR